MNSLVLTLFWHYTAQENLFLDFPKIVQISQTKLLRTNKSVMQRKKLTQIAQKRFIKIGLDLTNLDQIWLDLTRVD